MSEEIFDPLENDSFTKSFRPLNWKTWTKPNGEVWYWPFTINCNSNQQEPNCFQLWFCSLSPQIRTQVRTFLADLLNGYAQRLLYMIFGWIKLVIDGVEALDKAIQDLTTLVEQVSAIVEVIGDGAKLCRILIPLHLMCQAIILLGVLFVIAVAIPLNLILRLIAAILAIPYAIVEAVLDAIDAILAMYLKCPDESDFDPCKVAVSTGATANYAQFKTPNAATWKNKTLDYTDPGGDNYNINNGTFTHPGGTIEMPDYPEDQTGMRPTFVEEDTSWVIPVPPDSGGSGTYQSRVLRRVRAHIDDREYATIAWEATPFGHPISVIIYDSKNRIIGGPYTQTDSSITIKLDLVGEPKFRAFVVPVGTSETGVVVEFEPNQEWVEVIPEEL